MSTPVAPDVAIPRLLTRRDKLLMREVEACEDPVCCCEAEPRWLRFQSDRGPSPELTEWEMLDRSE